MVLNGLDNSQAVEIIDFSSPTTVCANLPDYPLNLRGSFGGLLGKQTPLVCGGTWTIRSCYVFVQGQWQQSFTLKENRFHSSTMVSSPYRNSSHLFFTLGNLPSSRSAEVLTEFNGWEIIGPPLPDVLYHNCLITLDETTIMIISGGNGDNWRSTKTYIFSTMTNVWTTGPSLTTGRYAHGCGKLPENKDSSKEVIVVAGGYSDERSVEFLNGINSNWRPGQCYANFLSFSKCYLPVQ